MSPEPDDKVQAFMDEHVTTRRQAAINALISIARAGARFHSETEEQFEATCTRIVNCLETVGVLEEEIQAFVDVDTMLHLMRDEAGS